MMRYFGTCFASVLVFCIIISAGIQSAYATATLRLDYGGGYIDIADGSANDISPGTDVITYSGAAGNFIVLVATGVQTGSNSLPVLGFNTFNVTGSASGGSLTALFSNTGFGPPMLPSEFEMHGSGTRIMGNSGIVSFAGYIDNSNELFGDVIPLGSLGPYNANSFSGDTGGSIISLSNPYSLTAKATIDLGASTMLQTTMSLGIVSEAPYVSVVPEPISLILFIIGGAILGFRRFVNNRAA